MRTFHISASREFADEYNKVLAKLNSPRVVVGGEKLPYSEVATDFDAAYELLTENEIDTFICAMNESPVSFIFDSKLVASYAELIAACETGILLREKNGAPVTPIKEALVALRKCPNDNIVTLNEVDTAMWGLLQFCVNSRRKADNEALARIQKSLAQFNKLSGLASR